MKERKMSFTSLMSCFFFFQKTKRKTVNAELRHSEGDIKA